MTMLRTLQAISGAAFFLLGLSFFAAYVLVRNGMYPHEASVWMQAADLPLACSALVYGGTSVYGGLREPGRHSPKLAAIIAIPLIIVFAMILAMNFWPA